MGKAGPSAAAPLTVDSYERRTYTPVCSIWRAGSSNGIMHLPNWVWHQEWASDDYGLDWNTLLAPVKTAPLVVGAARHNRRVDTCSPLGVGVSW